MGCFFAGELPTAGDAIGGGVVVAQCPNSSGKGRTGLGSMLPCSVATASIGMKRKENRFLLFVCWVNFFTDIP